MYNVCWVYVCIALCFRILSYFTYYVWFQFLLKLQQTELKRIPVKECQDTGKSDVNNQCYWYFLSYAFGVCVAGYNQSFLEVFKCFK